MEPAPAARRTYRPTSATLVVASGAGPARESVVSRVCGPETVVAPLASHAPAFALQVLEPALAASDAFRAVGIGLGVASGAGCTRQSRRQSGILPNWTQLAAVAWVALVKPVHITLPGHVYLQARGSFVVDRQSKSCLALLRERLLLESW